VPMPSQLPKPVTFTSPSICRFPAIVEDALETNPLLK
jgi:hypothetical protein